MDKQTEQQETEFKVLEAWAREPVEIESPAKCYVYPKDKQPELPSYANYYGIPLR